MYEALNINNEEAVAPIFQVQLDSAFSSIDILREKRPDLLTGETDVCIKNIR
jgi:hypothetical protein